MPDMQTPSFTPSASVSNNLFLNKDFALSSPTFSPSFVPSFGTCDFTPSEKKTTELTAEEIEIIADIENIYYDQVGCRMIQKMLEDIVPGESAFASALLEIFIQNFA
jgi:hypothetical protein